MSVEYALKKKLQNWIYFAGESFGHDSKYYFISRTL